MQTSYFRVTLVIGFLLGLFSSVNLMAADNFQLTGQDGKTNLQAFRDDGKFTLVLLRYEGCKPCDDAEINMQRWYDKADQKKVSALIINTDEEVQQESVYARQSEAGVTITSLFMENPSSVYDAVTEITGKPFRAVPLFIFLGPDGEFIDDVLGAKLNSRALNKLIAGG